MSQGLGPSFDRAQARYDAMEDDHDCEREGHCWRRARISETNGEAIVEWKCSECGETKVE
jgi:hypothetical protein